MIKYTITKKRANKSTDTYDRPNKSVTLNES